MNLPTVPIDDHFPVDLANRLAAREVYNKHHYRPNSYLHKWWARRCGTTFRLILKGLVDDEAARAFLAPAGLQNKIIMDPMMGGGTTVHEAIRLGANVIAADIDPIPVLQARATLTDIPLITLESAYTEFSQELSARLAPHFAADAPDGEPGMLRFLLYGSRRKCHCATVVMVDTFKLKHRPHVAIQPGEKMLQVAGKTIGSIELTERLVSRQETHCPYCGRRYEAVVALPYPQQLVPLIVVGRTQLGEIFYRPVQVTDLQRIAESEQVLATTGWAREEFDLPAGPKSHELALRNIHNYLDLFSARQQLYLAHSKQLLAGFPTKIRLNLALLVSTSLEFNALLCGYKGGGERQPGAIRHVFAHHAYRFPYTVLENNPVFQPNGRKASGTLGQLFHDRIRRGRQWAAAPVERVAHNEGTKLIRIVDERDVAEEVSTVAELSGGQRRVLLHHGSAVTLPVDDDSVDYVVTDPPYFDSVQYGDLASFFRVWLRQLIPTAATWHYEVTDSAIDPRDQAYHPGGRYAFATILGEIFTECGRVLRPGAGRLIFTYHQGKAAGWATLNQALQTASFHLVNYYVVQSESPRSVHINRQQALTHDAILVFAREPRRTWPRPVWPADPASEHFTGACAAILGWSLQQPASAAELSRRWQGMMSPM